MEIQLIPPPPKSVLYPLLYIFSHITVGLGDLSGHRAFFVPFSPKCIIFYCVAGVVQYIIIYLSGPLWVAICYVCILVQ